MTAEHTPEGVVGERVLVSIEHGWAEVGTIIAFDGKLATVEFDETVNLPPRLGDGCMIQCQRELEELETIPPFMSDAKPVEYNYVVWDANQPDSTGPHFGPMTSERAEYWKDRPGYHVQKLGQETP